MGHVPVLLLVVQPIADNEAVGNFETHVGQRHVHFACLALVQQRADTQARRSPGLQCPQQVAQRGPGVNNVLDDQHVPAFDTHVQVLDNPHDAAGLRAWAVTRHGHEIHLQRQGQFAGKVHHERHRRFEHAHEEQVHALVIGADLPGQLGHALLDGRCANQLTGEGRWLFGHSRRRHHNAAPSTSSAGTAGTATPVLP